MSDVQSVKKQTLSGIKWTAIEQFSIQAITFVLGIILARLLSPSDYGTVGLLSVFMAVSGAFVDSGFGQALIRKQDIKDIDYSTVFYFNIVISALCYLLLSLGSPLIADFFKMPILADIVKVYCLILFIDALGSVQNSRLTKNLNFKTLARVGVSRSIFSGLVGVSMAYAGFGVWALVWQSVFSSIFNVCALWIVAKWHPRMEFSVSSFKEMFNFGSKLLAGGLLWTVYSNIVPIIIGKFYSAKDLGFYSRGTSLAQMPEKTILGIIDRVTYPILAKLQDDTDRLITIYRKYIKATSMAIVFALFFFASLAKPIVYILLTEKWADCIIYLQIFVFAMAFEHIQRLNLNLLKVTGYSGLVLKLEIYKRLISFSLILAGIPFGVKGICISQVIYAQIALVFNTYYSGKIFKMTYLSQMRDFMPYVIMSLISCAPSFLLTFTNLPYWLMILFGIVITPSVYWLMLVIKKDESYIEFVKPVINKFIQKCP